MAHPPYRVLIVGAGQIGAFYDTPNSSTILTHAHAFSVTPGFTLAGFVDIDAKKGQEAANVWNTHYFSSIDQAFAHGPIDVVCVAVPDAYHYQTLKALTNYPVKLIVAEKPFCGDVEKAQEILTFCEQNRIAIQVNYNRRFVPEFQALASKIQSGAFGDCLGGMGIYGKGFFHNGSHMVNLLQFLFGHPDVKTGTVFDSLSDFGPDDPSLSLQLVLPNQSTFTLQAVDSRAISLFEFDLLFERQRVRMLKSGFLFYYFDTAENDTFAGYRNYVMRETVETRLGQALGFAAENIKAHLDMGEALQSSAESAIKTLVALSGVKPTTVFHV